LITPASSYPPSIGQPPTGLPPITAGGFSPLLQWTRRRDAKNNPDVTGCSSGGNLWLQAPIHFSNSLGFVLYYTGNVVSPVSLPQEEKLPLPSLLIKNNQPKPANDKR